jgi:hypothetical protein
MSKRYEQRLKNRWNDKSSVRLVDQDVGLSRRKQEFNSPTEYQPKKVEISPWVKVDTNVGTPHEDSIKLRVWTGHELIEKSLTISKITIPQDLAFEIKLEQYSRSVEIVYANGKWSGRFRDVIRYSSYRGRVGGWEDYGGRALTARSAFTEEDLRVMQREWLRGEGVVSWYSPYSISATVRV